MRKSNISKILSEEERGDIYAYLFWNKIKKIEKILAVAKILSWKC